MADVIRYSEESVDALCASLEDMYAQMDDAARKLRNVRITRDTGGSVQISQTVRLSGGRSVGGESLLDFVAGLNRAMREEADALHDLKMGLGKVRTIFDEEERDMADMAESLYIGDGTEVTERRIPYGGAAFVTLDLGNARPLGTLAASNPKPIGKDDAQDLINFYLGDNVVSQFLFWYDSKNERAKLYWKVLTGETKGMTQAEINAVLTEFVTVAKTANAVMANDRVEQLRGVVDMLADWGGEAESDLLKSTLMDTVLDGLDVEMPMGTNVEEVIMGVSAMLTAKDMLMDVPQAQYAQSMLERLEKTGTDKVTIDSVISGQNSAADMALDATVSDYNKKQATKYAKMLYGIEKSLGMY